MKEVITMVEARSSENPFLEGFGVLLAMILGTLYFMVICGSTWETAVALMPVSLMAYMGIMLDEKKIALPVIIAITLIILILRSIYHFSFNP